MEPTP